MLSNIHYMYDVIYIFLLGGLSGTVYELLLNLILHGVIEDRSDSILSPFFFNTEGYFKSARFNKLQTLFGYKSISIRNNLTVGCCIRKVKCIRLHRLF